MTPETIQSVKDLIQTVGFPVAIAIYLLWRYDRQIGKTMGIVRQILTLHEQALAKQGDNEKILVEAVDIMKMIKMTLDLKLK